MIKKYASPEMRGIWTDENRYRLFIQLWAAASRVQALAGLIPMLDEQQEFIIKKIINDPDTRADFVWDVAKHDIVVQHDLQAVLDVLTEQTGYHHFHVGLTGRDITDMATQSQIMTSQHWLGSRARTLFHELREFCLTTARFITEARTHNQPAQVTTIGRKFSIYLEQLSQSLIRFMDASNGMYLKVVGGPIGVGMETFILDGDKFTLRINMTKAMRNAVNLNVPNVPSGIMQGQIYPREEDRAWVSRCVGVGSALSNMAKTIRLMSGRGIIQEGYNKDRVGSSSMPHKTNPSRSERICGLYSILCGYEDMLSRVAGDQWEEGDVSCSVVQRVALSGAAMALDAILQNAHDVLSGLVVNAENGYNITNWKPELLSSLWVAKLVKEGVMNQSQAYAFVKEEIKGINYELRKDLREKSVNMIGGSVNGVNTPHNCYLVDKNPSYHNAPNWKVVR